MKPFNKNKRERIISNIDSLTNGDPNRDYLYCDDYLNVNAFNLDLSESLYRIFDWKHFINDLNDSKLILIPTLDWVKLDPFESFLLNAKVNYRGKRGRIIESYYGLCWSLKSDCDGLWKNYSSNKKKCVVKVKTNAKKLFAAIYNIYDPLHSNKYFIGKVQYLKERSILNFLKHKYDLSEFDDGLMFAKQFFIKRSQFKYEEEVRIIARNSNPLINFKIPIDPNSLYDEIVFDPFISASNFTRKKKEIEKTGYKGSILHSNLYNKTTFVLKIR
jgi:hypothetical protein